MQLLTTILLTSFIAGILTLEIEIINQWNFLNFQFPYDPELINSFRPENAVFTGLEITDDRLFVSIPRLRSGVPATLNTVPRRNIHSTAGDASPPLRPYPNWSFHRPSKTSDNCTGLTSVYRIRKDSCNRLWVLDSGVQTSLEDFQRVCPPKILVFDLATDQVVRNLVFPREVLRPASLLTNLVIDESVQGTCDNSFVYICDTAAPGLIVYDSSRETAWRVTHPSMYPDPDYSDYTIAGETFTLMDGIVGLTHSPRLGTVFFQPLATDRMFSIQTVDLIKGPLDEGQVLPVSLAGKKSSQGLGLALNPADDTVFFSPVRETSIASWNPVNNHQSLIAYNPESLQFAAELRWNANDNAVWLLSTRFQKFFRRTATGNEINLRIIRIRLGPQKTYF